MEIYGQEKIISDIMVNIEACKQKSKPLPHMIFFGASGCGKTMFADYLAMLLKLDVKGKPKFTRLTGGGIATKDDLEDLAFNIGEGDLVFIDEIHDFAKKASLREIFYEVMDKFKIYGMDLKPFTLLGATTDVGSLPFEFRNRFVLQYRIEDYKMDDIVNILKSKGCPPDVAIEVAKRSRFVPRLAISLYLRCKHEAISLKRTLTVEVAEILFKRNNIDKYGLDVSDRKILKFMLVKQAHLRRNAIGINSLSDQVGITEEDIKVLHEPYLTKMGFIERTPKGRILTLFGKEYIE